MSQPAVRALAPLPFELVFDDGEPLETEWHVEQMNFLKHLIRRAMVEQGRTDFYIGGNNFVYYSIEQAWEVAQEEEKGLPKRAFRGPDVFWVGGVDPDRERKAWIAWEEDGRLPDLIVELLSPSTARNDRTVKKDLYARVFRTSEYFLYDPDRRRLEGFRLVRPGVYRPLEPDAEGRLRSEQLGALLGLWHGAHEGRETDWVRLFRADGSLLPTELEAKDQQLKTERHRADAAEAELARLRALLGS